jgi:hypothetical protein
MSACLMNAFGSSWGQSEGSTRSRFSTTVITPPAIPQPRVSPVSTAGALRWLSPTMTRLTELMLLQQNWDGRSSGVIAQGTTEFVLTMLVQVMPPDAAAPSLVPMGRGELQLVWSTEGGQLEVEVTKPNTVSAFYLDRVTDQEQEWHMTTEFSQLSRILWSVFRD